MPELLFVGTSDAFGAGGRRQSAILMRAGSGSVLLDCGPTTVTGLNDLGVEREELDAIAISHFHGDHFGGIPLLLLAALYQDGRRRPLRIAGPPGVEERVRAAAFALGHPIETREFSFPIEYQELLPGIEAQVGPVRVRAFETHHQPESCPHGLAVAAGRQRVVYSGDTGWFDGLPAHAAGADVFVTECTLLERGYPFHLSYEELALHRARFDCGRTLLTHLGPEMSVRRGCLELETADDGMAIKL